MINIHATFISIYNKGVLFIGESGCGKSDTALRMIMEKGAKLIADDRVIVEILDGKIFGRAPENLKGLIEIRNVGIGKFEFQTVEEISLCVELCSDKKSLERLPIEEYVDFLGVSVRKIKLYPFDCSILCKIIAILEGKICKI